MKKIAVVTATRAEYGLLTPLLRRIEDDDDLGLDLIVTGTHLSDKYGYTIDNILQDGFFISHQFSILEEENTPYDISVTMANAIKSFASCFRDDRSDMVVILGDRTEMLGVAAAAMNERIPIAHIHGGEVTEGAVDDCIRHALTKMSYLHFTSTESYRKRVIQLGEDPERVFNVGALGAENILNQELVREDLLRQEAGLPADKPYVVVTYHPVTLELHTVKDQINELCAAMEAQTDMFFWITASNADAGGDEANQLLIDFCGNHENAKFEHSLGMKRYLSAVKYASFVLGNSSSGILEAPVLGTPTVNIGDRQKGRIMADTVICCEPEKENIIKAMTEAVNMQHEVTNLYGKGDTSLRIIQVIKEYLLNDKIDLKKGFYEVETS